MKRNHTKKTICLFLSLLLVFTSFAFSFSSFAQSVEPEDINSNDITSPETIDYDDTERSDPLLTPEQVVMLELAERRLREKYSISSMMGTEDFEQIIHSLALKEVLQVPETRDPTELDFNDTISVTLTKRGTINSSFHDLFASNDAKLTETWCFSNNGIHYVIQSTCTDGSYMYVAVLAKTGDTIRTPRILRMVWNAAEQKYKINKVTKSNISFLGHVNDMAYNPNNNTIAFLYCKPGEHNLICTIPVADLFADDTLIEDDFQKYHIACGATSIDFNKWDNCYYIGITNHHRYFVRADDDFNIISPVQHEYRKYIYFHFNNSSPNNPEGWGRQTVLCDENYMYAVCSRLRQGVPDTMRIDIYDIKTGNYKKTIEFLCSDDNYFIEAESLCYYNGKLLLTVNYVESHDNITIHNFCYVNLSNLIFNIEFCPDETMAGTGHRKQFVFRGISTSLFSQRITNAGNGFLGWTAYRSEVNKWYYKNASGTRGWYTEGSQPAGYTKYVYTNMQNVSQTALAGEHLFMCAKWESDDYFNIDFISDVDDPNISMATQRVLYGHSTPLSLNQFQKDNRTFRGWNAYWVEKNKWYYIKPSTNQKQWFIEGNEEPGYIKYVYSNGQNVSQTATAGGHIEMHTVWNEYFIQYSVGGVPVQLPFGNIKFMKTGKYDLNNVPTTTITNWGTFGSYTFNGWKLYRKEENQWYYKNANNQFGWYMLEEQPTGYEIYILPTSILSLSNAALEGEHLILVATWLDE